MARIKIINPNTTWSLTNSLGNHLRQYVEPSTELITVSPQMGPPSIESFYDDYLSVPGILEEIQKGDREEAIDAYVIACFGDPGLYAARELTNAPVLGIAEAAMQMASMVAATFTIVTTLPRTRMMSERLLYDYGMKDKCRSIRTTPLHVLDLTGGAEPSVRCVIDECRQAVQEDAAESIVLGCAAMSVHRERIECEVGVPVIDGALAAVKFCEALVGCRIKTSKALTFAEPEAKPFVGILDRFGNQQRTSVKEI
ncbi:aspartate/glutamate racemase family protein [Alicyclobacillus pomorum]|uniref:aspartate/glutamate racemase family protein n=1 Tax=Alicyclobacillus pomorum TaxID=204470 RepID=UPI00047BA905|nr:aspartate/glutamate racemase family protein [Alicyclobacillus pomorum]